MTRRPQGSIQFVGTPYVPGRARGRLGLGTGQGRRGDVLVVEQRDSGFVSQGPAGVLVVEGAPFSHSMIHLRGLGVPTVIISRAQASLLTPGARVLLDGASGLVTTDFAAVQKGSLLLTRPLPGQPLHSADGEVVHLRASVRTASLARQAVVAGAAAIGLVRSEFLLPKGTGVPTEEHYRKAFAELCEAAAPLAVTVRLLDLAPDKLPDWVSAQHTVGGPLGLQGVRLFGVEAVRGVLHAQVAALDGLAERFELRLLIPYLVRFEELHHWAGYVSRRLSRPLPIGAMVETPAAALDLANWLDIADFVALGCNDLMQCLFAADRDRPELRDYLDPYAPVLYRLLRQVAEGAKGDLGRVQLCGVLPQLPGVLPILLGLGYRAFSVDPGLIPYLAHGVRETRVADARAMAEAVCAARESRQVAEIAGVGEGGRVPFLAGAPDSQ